jgi:hypothetical protein
MTKTNQEEWRTIQDWPAYEVSSLGNFRRGAPGQKTYVGRPLRVYKNERTGYCSITLSKTNEFVSEMKTLSAHRLVALTFIPNPEGKREVDHINCDRTDNRVENLRWATTKENIRRYTAKETKVKHIHTGEVKTFEALIDAIAFVGVSSAALSYRRSKGIPLIYGDWEILPG